MKNSLNSLSEKELSKLTAVAQELFEKGECCPLRCGGGEVRPCNAVKEGIKVASFAVHEGEEPPVSGWNGAGNIFFSGCSAKCVFCQNWPISHENNGGIYSISDFADNVLRLLNKKVHNINLVTSDHYFGRVIKAFHSIKDKINVPIVYNCNGAHTEELFRMILKISDIFLFDVKYSDDSLSTEFSNIKEYVRYNEMCLDMLYKSKVKWVENDLGILEKGLIIRHLVLPGQVENSIGVIETLRNYKEMGLDFKLSLMSQYFPAHLAFKNSKINRPVTKKEYEKVKKLALKYQFDGWIQELN